MLIFRYKSILIVIEDVTYYFKEPMGENFQPQLTKLVDETLPEHFTRFEGIVEKNGGFLSNGKLSWVDFYFAATVEYVKYMMVWAGKKEKEEVIAHFPHLTALYEKVRSLPSIKKWIQERPEESVEDL